MLFIKIAKKQIIWFDQVNYMSREHFAYHIKPKNFTGDTIFPLNLLIAINEEIARKAQQKYEGRRDSLKNIVVYDPGNSTHKFMGADFLKWGDVAFFSMIDPSLVFSTLTRLGFEDQIEPNLEAFKIPISAFPKETLVWVYTQDFSGLSLP